MPTLTPEDLDAIKKIVQEEVSDVRMNLARLDGRVARQGDRLEGFEDRIKLLPTRDEFLSRMDEIMGLLRTLRDEFVALTHRVRGHEDRVAALEDIHPGGQHPTS